MWRFLNLKMPLNPLIIYLMLQLKRLCGFYCKLFQSPGLFFEWVMTFRNRSKVYIAFSKFDLCVSSITVFINVWSLILFVVS